MSQKYAGYSASTGAITGFYDAVDSPPPTGATVLAIADADWQACLAVSGYTVVAGVLTAPTADALAALASAEAALLLKLTAQTTHNKSDALLIRCLEHGVTIPPAWIAYRFALRQVIAGTLAALPTQPAVPTGI